jgi:hypothetical protein
MMGEAWRGLRTECSQCLGLGKVMGGGVERNGALLWIGCCQDT